MPNVFGKKWIGPDGTVDYYAYIESPEWAAKRRQRMEMDGCECVICGRDNNEVRLQVHHMTYEHLGNEQMDDLITVCETCHSIITQIENEVKESVWETMRDWQWVKSLIASDAYPRYIRFQIIAIILKAISDHSDGLPDLNKISQPEVQAYIENIMEAVRDTRRREMDAYVTTSTLGIAQKLKWGTRQGKSTVQENAESYSQDIQAQLDLLPKRPKYDKRGSADND